MKPNEGSIDRIIRLVLGGGLIAAAIFWLGAMDGAILGIGAGIVGIVLLVTALVGFCPAYKICGMSTCKLKAAE